MFLDTNTFSTSTSFKKHDSYGGFKFKYQQKLKFIYPIIYVIVSTSAKIKTSLPNFICDDKFLCSIMFHFISQINVLE